MVTTDLFVCHFLPFCLFLRLVMRESNDVDHLNG